MAGLVLGNMGTSIDDMIPYKLNLCDFFVVTDIINCDFDGSPDCVYLKADESLSDRFNIVLAKDGNYIRKDFTTQSGRGIDFKPSINSKMSRLLRKLEDIGLN